MRVLPAVVLFLAACGGTRGLYVDAQRDVDGAWSVPDAPVALETDGNTLTIRFQGRTFVFPGMNGLRGVATEDEVTLRGDIGIHLDAEVFAVDTEDGRFRRPMKTIPPGARVTWTHGAALVE